VNFVNENDAGSILLALLEKIAHAAGADTNKHFHKVRAGNREERDVRFTSDGACQKGLPRPRGADQQNALGNAAAEFLELLGIFEEFDNLLEFLLGFIGSRNVLEGGLLLLGGKQARAGLAKAESFVSASLHLAHQEQAEADQEKKREAIEEEKHPIGVAVFLDFDLHSFVTQLFGDGGCIFFGDGHLEFAIGGPDVLTLKFVAYLPEIHGDFFDVKEVTMYLGQVSYELQGEYIRPANRKFQVTIAKEDAATVTKELRDKAVQIKVKEHGNADWVLLLLNGLPLLLLVGFCLFLMRQMQAGGNKALSFGKSRARL